MSRWIDADALIAELQKDEERFDKEAEDCRKNSSNYTDCYMQAMSSRADGIRDAIVEVYDAPTIDAVEVVHGEWIPNPKIGWGETWVCSICGEKTTSSVMGKPRYRYCPWCGAKMKGTDDE